MRKSILLLLLLVLTGCGKKDDSSDSHIKQTPHLKPMPQCQADAPVTIAWTTQSKNIYRYQLQLSVSGHAVFYNEVFSGDKRSQEIDIERGFSLQAQLTEQLANGSQNNVFKQFFIPTCADRDAYRKKHHNYDEPIVVNIEFK